MIGDLDHSLNQDFDTIIERSIRWRNENEEVKCPRLFRPKIRPMKTGIVAHIRQGSNTLPPSAGVSDWMPVP